MAADLITVPLEKIEPSPRNPRQKLQRLDELAASIDAYGLLQPIVLRPRLDGRFEIIAGHRRLQAIKSLGWRAVPATVRKAEPDDAYLLTLIENLQREDLTAREESQALEVLVRERGWGVRQVAEAVKRSPSYVSRRLRVFEDSVLAPLVLEGRLSVSVAEELLPLDGLRKEVLAREAAEAGWDRRQLRLAMKDDALRRTKTRASVLRRTRDLRAGLRTVGAADLTEAERRELRMLFRELALLAKAPTERRKAVLPQLPAKVRSAAAR
jgi:ParB family chromosome partitioning protein